MTEHRFAAGTCIGGRYTLLGVLGAGAMGVVYAATREASGDVIALKIMHAHLAGDAQVRGRFAREAHILERLRGEHVCPIIESGEFLDPQDPSRHLLYVAMPKLATDSLASMLGQGHTFDIASIYAIALQIGEALQSAHAQGVIHRDLKPENILIDANYRATVIDFGMAKIVHGSGAGTTNLTVADMVFGTPEYMSPEQARGDELDGRCDVYALGVILYELATRQLPFEASNPVAVLAAVVSQVPKRPREATTRVIPAALDALILHAMAKDSNARYGTAGALIRALTQARSVPTDVEAVHPAHFGTAAEQSDVSSATMPELPAMRLTPVSTVVRRGPSVAVQPQQKSNSRVLLGLLLACVAVSVGVVLALIAK
jgi:eukaryotic-like serine/threonine-protein kinase